MPSISWAIPPDSNDETGLPLFLQCIREDARVKLAHKRYMKLLKRSYLYSRSLADIECALREIPLLMLEEEGTADFAAATIQFAATLMRHGQTEVIKADDVEAQLLRISDSMDEFVPEASSELREFVNNGAVPRRRRGGNDLVGKSEASALRLERILDNLIRPFLAERLQDSSSQLFELCVEGPRLSLSSNSH